MFEPLSARLVRAQMIGIITRLNEDYSGSFKCDNVRGGMEAMVRDNATHTEFCLRATAKRGLKVCLEALNRPQGKSFWSKLLRGSEESGVEIFNQGPGSSKFGSQIIVPGERLYETLWEALGNWKALEPRLGLRGPT